jgi:histidyl-tRNA synthetase
VLLIGEEEMNSGRLTLKNMVSGEQQKMGINEMIKLIRKV